ncbi:MAG: periplasmic heavy metal sensor [Myxococcota bacterium]
MSPRVKGVLLGLVLLAAGGAAGAVGMRIYDFHLAKEWMQRAPVDKRNALLAHVLDRRLDLDDTQRERLKEALEAQRPAFEALVAESAPRRAELRQELVEECRSFLRPAQFRRLERLNDVATLREQGGLP